MYLFKSVALYDCSASVMNHQKCLIKSNVSGHEMSIIMTVAAALCNMVAVMVTCVDLTDAEHPAVSLCLLTSWNSAESGSVQTHVVRVTWKTRVPTRQTLPRSSCWPKLCWDGLFHLECSRTLQEVNVSESHNNTTVLRIWTHFILLLLT